MTDIESGPNDAAECGGCTLHDALHEPAVIERRAFLRAGAMALASLGVLGTMSRSAGAMMPVEMSPLAPRGGDRSDQKRYPVPAADGVTFDKDNSVIIARAAGKVYAFSLSCPHQNTALRWNADDKEFTCPKHKSHYKPDGQFIDGRATRDMDRLAIKRDGANVVVDVDVLYQQDLNTAQWAAAFITA
jgi:nitrite reductase/ring-hydroxylating ferredoxin subunit